MHREMVTTTQQRCLSFLVETFSKASIINFCRSYSFYDEADLTSGRFPFPLLFAHDLDSIGRLAYRGIRNFDIIHPL